jgi:rhodanese-related sulfurtransferase
MNDLLLLLQQHYGLIILLIIGLFIAHNDTPLITLLLGIDVISTQEAAIKMQDKSIFFDVRSIDEYDAKHITKAISVPYGTLTKDNKAINKTKHIVLYSNNDDNMFSIVTVLKKSGFIDISILSGGIDDWDAAGFATSSNIKG